MRFSLVEKQRFKQQVERVLHVPGNYTGGILEMAIVLDARLSGSEVKETVAELAQTLRQHSEVFRNVRLNLVEWKPEEKLTGRVVPLPMLMLGSFMENYEPCQGELYADELFAYLRLFQARSKLILIVTSGEVQIREEEVCRKSLKPFLGRKFIWMAAGSESVMEVFLQKERCSYIGLYRNGET